MSVKKEVETYVGSKVRTALIIRKCLEKIEREYSFGIGERKYEVVNWIQPYIDLVHFKYFCF